MKKEKLKAHFSAVYRDIFGEDQEQFERIYADSVDEKTAGELLQFVRCSLKNRKNMQLLDIGCGFGTFVLVARKKGIDAIGIDTGKFALRCARERVSGRNAKMLFREASALHMPFKKARFDVVTMWNLLEHVSNYKAVIREAKRVLKPGGSLFILCPNYLSFRKEAHYHLWFPPLFPKGVAARYLRLRGRDPTFLLRRISYVTNPGIIWCLNSAGFSPDFSQEQLMFRMRALKKHHPRIASCVSHSGFLAPLLAKAYFYNPWKPSVSLHAVKGGG